MAHDMAGFILHRHHAGRMANGGAGRKITPFGNQWFQFSLWAVDQKFYFGTMRKTFSHTSNNGDRTSIAAHCIDRNDDSVLLNRRHYRRLACQLAFTQGFKL